MRAPLHPPGGEARLAAADVSIPFRQVNVVVSFSIVAESFGRTLAEAMAARRPVIAYGRGAAPEFVRDGIDGYLVPSLDITQALTHLETLAVDRARVSAMGNAGRARVKELFAPSVFASSLDDIYQRVLKISKASALRSLWLTDGRPVRDS